MSIEDDEDSGHTHSEDEGNIHKSSLGVHKINIYTGELEFTK